MIAYRVQITMGYLEHHAKGQGYILRKTIEGYLNFYFITFEKNKKQFPTKVCFLSKRTTDEFRSHIDQRSDDSNSHRVKGEQVETVIKRYHRCFHNTLYRYQSTFYSTFSVAQ